MTNLYFLHPEPQGHTGCRLAPATNASVPDAVARQVDVDAADGRQAASPEDQRADNREDTQRQERPGPPTRVLGSHKRAGAEDWGRSQGPENQRRLSTVPFTRPPVNESKITPQL